MISLSHRINETPLAPYLGILTAMNKEQKMIVLSYLYESLEEPKSDIKDQILEKYKNLHITDRAHFLAGSLSLTKDEVQDERTKYILGYD